MNKLLPCPFCGKSSAEINFNGEWRYYSVMCGHCSTEGEAFYPIDEEWGGEDAMTKAIKAWNTRYNLTSSEDYNRGYNQALSDLHKFLDNVHL